MKGFWTKSNKYLYFLEKNFEYINHIHLKDKIKKNKVNCKLGLGIVNFKKLFFVLKKKKNKGSITLETSFKKNPLKEAKQNLNFAKSFLYTLFNFIISNYLLFNKR